MTITTIKKDDRETQNIPIKTKNSLINVVLDPGTSCTKVIFNQGKRGKPKYLVDSSVVYSVDFAPEPYQTYVKLPDNEQYYLVGMTAASSKHSASIKQLKSELLTIKVLGIIGQIAKSRSLSSTFDLNLNLLLPISEIGDLDFIQTQLSLALEGFNYSGAEFQVNLKSLEIQPEGTGICSYFSSHIGFEEYDLQTIVYLMFGYRNTSLLLFENGKINFEKSLSTDLGFYNYLDLVAKYGSGLYREDIQQAIFTEAKYGVNNKCRQVITGFNSQIRVEDLIHSLSLESQARERESIDKAITRADAEYWQLLNNWLKGKLPPLSKLDSVVYCGGSTSFIETPLKEFFENWHGELLNSHDMSITMLEKLELSSIAEKKFIQQHLPIRLADAWGVYVDLVNVKI